MTATELESPLGRALADDAAKRIERVHVAEKFPVRLNRWAWLPLAPAVLGLFVSQRSGIPPSAKIRRKPCPIWPLKRNRSRNRARY